MSAKNILEKLIQSPAVKFLTIAFLVLLLLIPMTRISDLISERKNRELDVENEISQKWGKQQVVTGPVIAIPYNYTTKVNNVVSMDKKWIFLLPDELHLQSNIIPETLKRGIYTNVVYRTTISISGNFPELKMNKLNIDSAAIEWKNAELIWGVEDLKGLQDIPKLQWDNKLLEIEPDANKTTLFTQNLIAPLSIHQATDTKKSFNFQLVLRGSKSINFLPLANHNDLSVQGKWDNPSFNGGFLPENRKVEKDLFSANWKIPSLSRNLPQQWTGDMQALYTYGPTDSYVEDGTYTTVESKSATETNKTTLSNNDMVTVNFLPEINTYQKTTRVTKYGILVILLTFTALLFTEFMTKKKIYLIHYILIGMAMVLFYGLLLSFSEHIGFNWAYVIAAIATIGLVATYIKSISKSTKTALYFVGILGIFYGFIFNLMQLRDYSLITGMIGIFIILAILMRLTTKINWDMLSEDRKENA